MRKLDGTPAGGWVATRVLRNGGGYSLSPGFANDGTMVCGADVLGSTVLVPGASEWRQLITAKTIPTGDILPTLNANDSAAVLDNCGCYAVAIAPSNSSRIYTTYNGYLYVSSDQGFNFTRTALAQKKLLTNSGNTRHMIRKLVVDPSNPDAFLFGTLGQSVFASTNAGTTVTDLVVPAGVTGDSGQPWPHLVAVDPTSTVSGTPAVHQRWYYSVRYPTLVTGTVSGAGPVNLVTVGNSFSINGTTVTLTGQTVFTTASDINNANIPNIWATWTDNTNYIQIVNTIAGSVTLANVSGTPLAALGLTAGTTAANTTGGIYESTSGPLGTYTRIANSPADCNFLSYDNTGRIWAVGSSGKVSWYTKTAGSFTAIYTVSGSNTSIASVAVNPSNSSQILIQASTNIYQSIDNGVSFPNNRVFAGNNSTSPAQQLNRASTQNYLDTGPSHNWVGSDGPIMFNPATNELWQAWGFGPRKCSTIPATNSSPIIWVEQVKGIDEANCTDLIYPPGGSLHASFLDLGPWKITDYVNATNYPRMPQKSSDDWTLYPPVIVQPCDCQDYAADNPLWIAAATSKGWSTIPKLNQHHGYSTDGGETWTLFPTQPPSDPTFAVFYGADLVVGLQGQVMIAWPDKQTIVRTKDGGNTWDVPPFPNLPANGNENGIGDFSASFFSKKNLVYDKTGRALYLYDYGPAADLSKAGIWKTTDFGDTWTQVYSGVFTNGQFHSRLRSVPGNAGLLYFTCGIGQNNPLVKLVDNFNGTMTATNVANTAYIYDVGFSPVPGLSFPAAMVFGYVNSQWGYHISYDQMATWTHLGYLGDWLDWPKIIQGNPDKLEFYAGLANSGILRFAYSFTAKVGT